MYNRARENLDNVKWPDVTAGTRKNGNPYCYLMEGYVRLATLQEIKDWMKIMQDPSGKLYGGYQKEVWKTSSTGKKVYLSDFEKRMQGRNLLQELERAGIKNLDAVRKEGLGGLTFRYERWGVSSGYQTFKLTSYMHYTADHWSFRSRISGFSLRILAGFSSPREASCGVRRLLLNGKSGMKITVYVTFHPAFSRSWRDSNPRPSA